MRSLFEHLATIDPEHVRQHRRVVTLGRGRDRPDRRERRLGQQHRAGVSMPSLRPA